MIHKCLICGKVLIPCTFLKTDNIWAEHSVSAEIVLHLNARNCYYWRCPECGNIYYSEIESNANRALTYEGIKNSIKREMLYYAI